MFVKILQFRSGSGEGVQALTTDGWSKSFYRNKNEWRCSTLERPKVAANLVAIKLK